MTVITIKEPNNVSDTDGADTDFFVLLFIITSIIHKKQFAYNTHQDYNYPSLPSTAHATLKGGSLTLPATVSGRDTVIAKIRIKSNWMGLLFLPFVETISSKGKWKQYFEYGAKGVRYINLSDTFSDSDKTVRLEGRYLTLADQEIELSVYPRENLDGKKSLSLRPMPTMPNSAHTVCMKNTPPIQ